MNFKKICRRILSWISWLLVAVVCLLLISIALLRIPSIQNKLVQRVIVFLEGKLDTNVQLESIYIAFPKTIVLKGLYFEDQSRDTLLYAGELRIDTDLWSLTQHQIQLNGVELNHVRLSVKRNATDTAFNFSYIERAFAGDPSKNAAYDSAAAPWEFNLKDVSISKTNITYTDHHDGNEATISIGKLTVDMDAFDINQSIYTVKSFDLADARVEILQKKEPSTTDHKPSATTTTPTLALEDANLTNVKASYTNTASGQHAILNLGEFILEVNEMDPVKKKLDVNKIELKNSFVSYRQNHQADRKDSRPQNDETGFSEINIPWHITVNEIKLSGNSIQYDDANQPLTKDPLDFNHMRVDDLRLSAQDLEVQGSSMTLNLDELSFHEKKGFHIKSLSTSLALTRTKLEINTFTIASGKSELTMNGTADFTSLSNYKDAAINLHVRHARVAVADILFFSPTLLDSLPVNVSPSTMITAEAALTGSLKNLTIQKLNLQTLRNTILACHGNIKGLPDSKKLIWDIDLQKFYTTSTDLAILPDSLLPASIQIPAWLQLTGKFSGVGELIRVDGELTSDFGDLEVKGKIDRTSPTTYDAIIKTNQLHLGKILKQPQTMGALGMTATIKGSGTTMETLSTAIILKVDSFQYQQYTYKAFHLEGRMDKYLFSGTASLTDENLDVTLKGDLDYQQDVPRYKFNLALRNANFQKLNLSQRPLQAKGVLDVNLSTQDFKLINGNMAIRDVAIFNGKSLYRVDSLLFVSIDQEGESSMKIQSDIIAGEFTGTFNLFSLARVMKQHFNQYFSLQDETIADFKTPQQFKFDLTLKNTDLITEILIPDLDPFVPGEIKGEFNSETKKLDISIGLSQITYGSVAFDSISLRINSDETALDYTIRLKNVEVDTLTIDVVQLTGKIENDSILTAFEILNSKNEKKYLLGGIIKSHQEKFRFQFLPDQIVLNYTPWTVPVDNYLEFSSQGIQAHQFILTGEKEQIALQTTVKDSTVALQFKDVQLSSLTRIVRGVMPARGTLNGDFKFTTSSQGRFSSKLEISQLEVLQQPFGDLTLSLSHAAKRYAIDLLIHNEESNVKVTGHYAPETKSPFNLSANLSPLTLQWVEPLSFGHIRNAKGVARGNLIISGTFNEPSIRGKISFENASLTPTYLKSTLYLDDESISFEESGIVFNNFTIRDNKRNTAVIQGSILTRAYKDFRFKAQITTKNFLLFNTTEEDNKLYYGKIRLNMRAEVRGSANRPRVDVVASLSDESELTYVVPQEEKSAMEQKGIVQFVSKKEKLNPFMMQINPEDTVTSTFGGINLSARIELNDQETLNIVIDPATGDKLSVKGNANLTLDIDASGNINLSGQYKVTEGKYKLSFYKLVKREFDIEKGGTIVWSGNPLNATLDLRTQYYVETSPLDLVVNQINTTDQAQRNMYRQRLPFLVLMDIKGQLLAPQISFKIDMPVDKRDAFGGAIYAKLNDLNSRESDVNKQVFALLILKRFVSDSPFESQSGSDVANTTRTSVSRLLSDQLNRLSEQVKGVELDVDIKSYEDYSTGTAQGDTQVQLRVSKSLLNDRLVIKLAGNVDVEGESANQDITDYIGDVALEYKLTGDGRFRITAFRLTNYDMINGEVIETGTGLIYVKDYNTLRELFKANAKEN